MVCLCSAWFVFAQHGSSLLSNVLCVKALGNWSQLGLGMFRKLDYILIIYHNMEKYVVSDLCMSNGLFWKLWLWLARA